MWPLTKRIYKPRWCWWLLITGGLLLVLTISHESAWAKHSCPPNHTPDMWIAANIRDCDKNKYCENAKQVLATMNEDQIREVKSKCPGILAKCVGTSLTTNKIVRGSAEACQCLKRLKEVDKGLDALLAAHEKWDEDMKKHECTRIYLGKAFKRKYGRTDEFSDPKPGKKDIEKAEKNVNGKIALAKTDCGKTKGSELKDLKEIRDLRENIAKNTSEVNKKESLVCRQMTVRVACIDEAIDFYTERYKKKQEQVDGNLALNLCDKRDTEEKNKIKKCSKSGDQGKPAPTVCEKNRSKGIILRP